MSGSDGDNMASSWTETAFEVHQEIEALFYWNPCFCGDFKFKDYVHLKPVAVIVTVNAISSIILQ